MSFINEFILDFITDIFKNHWKIALGAVVLISYIGFSIGGDILTLLKKIKWKYVLIFSAFFLTVGIIVSYINFDSFNKIKELELALQVHELNAKRQSKIIERQSNDILKWSENSKQYVDKFTELGKEMITLSQKNETEIQAVLKNNSITSCDSAMDYLLNEGLKI